jgi:hypothetical protein
MSISRMTVGELREKFLEVFGKETRSRHSQCIPTATVPASWPGS